MASKKIVVTTPRAVASYPKLVKPDLFVGKGKKAEDQKPKFKLKMVFDGDTDFGPVEEKIVEAIRAEWGEKIKPSVVKSCIKTGDAINEDREANGKEPYESLAGKFVIDASSLYRPRVVDAKKRVINPNLVRGGDIVKAILALIPCEPSGKKTIGVRLLAVQLIEKRSGDGAGWAEEFAEEEGYENEDGFSDESGDADEDEKPARGRAPKQESTGGDDDF